MSTDSEIQSLPPQKNEVGGAKIPCWLIDYLIIYLSVLRFRLFVQSFVHLHIYLFVCLFIYYYAAGINIRTLHTVKC